MDHAQPTAKPALETTSGDRMVTLDGMRGVAALAVAIYHFDKLIMPGGYLAVDFFFLLSGFVLTRSYGDRLSRAGALLDFARIRAIRLLPIHMIGILFGASYMMIGVLRHWADTLSAPAFAGSVLLNLVMLPAPVNDTFFPSNPPAWSLMYEMLASLALPAFLTRRSNATLLAGCAVALLSMAVISCQLIGPAGVPGVLTEPLTYGWGYPYWYIGALRTAFAFPLGIVIARLTDGRERTTSRWVPLLLAVLALTMMLPTGGLSHVAYVLGCIVIVFPVLLVLGSRIEPTGITATFARFAGDISFPLYAVHYTMHSLFGYYVQRRLLLPEVIALPLYLGISIALAWLIARHIDPAVRQALRRRFPGKRAADAQTGLAG